MAETIPQFIDKYKDVEDKVLLWEMVKMEIRSFTITFTKTKAKKCRDQEKFLTKEAERLQNLVDSQSTPEHINEHMTVKSKLEKISFDRSEAHAFAPRQDGTNLENEAPNTFAILKKGITSINVLPA